MREFESMRFGFGTPRYPYRVDAAQLGSVVSQPSSLDLLNTPTRYTNIPPASVTPSSPKGRNLPGLKEESFTHIIQIVFLLGTDSILEQAVREKGYECYLDLLGLDTDKIDSLQYPRDQGPDENGDPLPPLLSPVPKPLLTLLHGLKGYVHYRCHVVGVPLTPTNCMDINADEFHAYRGSPKF